MEYLGSFYISQVVSFVHSVAGCMDITLMVPVTNIHTQKHNYVYFLPPYVDHPLMIDNDTTIKDSSASRLFSSSQRKNERGNSFSQNIFAERIMRVRGGGGYTGNITFAVKRGFRCVAHMTRR